jgi:hypothetical protein
VPDQPLCGRRSSGPISASPSLPRFSFGAPSFITSVPKKLLNVSWPRNSREQRRVRSAARTAAAMPQRDFFSPAGRLTKDHRRARAGPSRRRPWRAHRPKAARSKACSPGGMRRGSGFVPTPSGFTYLAMWLSADNHCLVRGVCSPAFALSCPRTTKLETASGLSVCKFVTNRVLL